MTRPSGHHQYSNSNKILYALMTCYLSKHLLHFLMTFHSNCSTRGGAPHCLPVQGWQSSGPVVKGVRLHLSYRWKLALLAMPREDELIHHTITSAKIIKNKNRLFYNENFQCRQAMGKQAPQALLAEA